MKVYSGNRMIFKFLMNMLSKEVVIKKNLVFSWDFLFFKLILLIYASLMDLPLIASLDLV